MKAITSVHNLYAESLPPRVLDKLCEEVRLQSKTWENKKTFVLKNVCAGGVEMALADMDSRYPVVLVLQLVLKEE